MGLGTYNSGPNTITRNTVLASSNGGVSVNFSAGTCSVDLVEPAARIRQQIGPVVAGAVTANSGSLVFSNNASVSFGLATNTNGGTITASVNVGGGAGLTVSAAGSSVSAGSLVFSNSNGLSFGMNGSTVTASHAFRLSAGANSASLTAVTFSDSNGVSFGLNGSVVTAAVSGIQQVRLFSANALHISSITNATSSTAVGSSIFFPQIATNSTDFFSQNNVFFGISSNSMLAVAQQLYFGPGGNFSAPGVNLLNSNGVSFGLGSTTTAVFGRIVQITASVEHPTVSHIGGNVMSNVTQLAFSNASNVTWSLSTAAQAVTVIASVAAGGGGGGSTLTVSANNGSFSATALSFAASNSRVLFSTNTDSQVFAQPFLAFSVGTRFALAANLGFSDSNGISFGYITNAGASSTLLSASYTVPAVVNSGLLNITNAASSVAASRLELANANGFSWLLSTGASVATLSASYTVPTVPTHTLAISAAGASVSNGTVVFSNSNNVSFGQAGSTVTASASVAATRDIGIVSHIGGNVVSSVSQLVFSNASNVTWNLSTAANAATVRASVAAGGGGGGITYSGFNPYAGAVADVQQVTQNTTNAITLTVNPILCPAFQCDRMVMPVFFSLTTSTHNGTYRISAGLYTRNGASLSLVTGTTFSQAFTISTGNTSLFQAGRLWTIPFTTTLAGSDYWLAVGLASSSASANASFSLARASAIGSSINGIFGIASNVTLQSMLGRGIFTQTATSSLPQSMAFTAITGNQSSVHRPPMLYFASSTQ